MKDFWKPSLDKCSLKITSKQLFFVFGSFLLIQLFLIPLTREVSLWFFGKHSVFFNPAFFDLYGIFLCGLTSFFALFMLDPKWRYGLFPKKKRAENFTFGVCLWLFSYPAVLFISQISAFFLWFFKGEGGKIEQVAVKHLIQARETPLIFIFMVIGIVFIVPFIEEILFRGILLTYFKGSWKRGESIALSSLIFSLFHFSPSQGWGNIELFFSIFTLSCFLGFAFEFKQSLFAPIGLHATFNALSIAMLFYLPLS